jgi:hypothetical protein
MENKLKYLYIRLVVREGEREHTHHCLHTTRAENIEFAVTLYTARFWGYSERVGDYWFAHGCEISISLETYKELSQEEHEMLHKLLY